MSTFNSFSTNQRRLTLMWNLVVLLFSVAAIGKGQAEDVSSTSTVPVMFFDLPSLSMALDVEKEDNALIPFQDQLKESMEAHLEKFYKNKLLTTEVGIPALVVVDLESQLLWKELWVEPKETTVETPNKTYNELSFVKKYEVRGIFNCKIKLQIDPVTTEYGTEKPVFVPQTLMNIFFLEAFQNEHYWDMMHGFLTTPLLRDIISADVEVLDVGFVYPYDENGDLRFKSDDDFLGRSVDYYDNSGMSLVMILGSVFIMLLFLALTAVWFYLCVVMKGDIRFKNKFRRKRSRDEGSHKGSSATGSTNSEDSGESDEEEEDDDEESVDISWASSITANLDAWASAITSIPLRDVDTKRRRKRGNKVVQRPYFRPSHEHSSYLDNITEADNESWCSSVRTGKSVKSSRSTNNRRKKKYNRSRPRRTEESSSRLASVASFDSEASTSSVASAVIYEDDAENSADDDDESQDNPLLIQRQVISLIPSEDEIDDSWNQGCQSFAEI